MASLNHAVRPEWDAVGVVGLVFRGQTWSLESRARVTRDRRVSLRRECCHAPGLTRWFTVRNAQLLSTTRCIRRLIEMH